MMNRPARRLLTAVLLIVSAGCTPTDVKPDAPKQYIPAKRDYGKVLAVWVYSGDGQLTAPPGTKLVAAELHLPSPDDGKFDLDDIDIFNADTGDNFGSDPYIQRLTLDGQFVNTDDPEVAEQREYRGIFVWAVPLDTKRVNFGYWGEMLFVNPVALGVRELTLPHTVVSATALEYAGAASDAYVRFRVLLHAQNSFRNFEPSSYTLVATRAPEEKDLCDCDAWIELDESRRHLKLDLRQRPRILENRWFLVEYWCPVGATPVRLNLFDQESPLPPVAAPTLPRESYESLVNAPREKHALHRLR